MLLYMIRHGQTDWNAEGRLQGQRDIPMNDFGRGQARANGVALGAVLAGSRERFDFVASPLGRTRETMELVRGAMGLPPRDYRTDDRLVEVSFGDWEGYTMAEIKMHARERVRERARAKWDFIPPGENAESYEILSWRIGSWLKDVTRPMVCVSHGGVFRALFKLLGAEREEAATTPIHQDRILRVDDSGCEWL
ncbi:phosphoglycerate mutase family protein [Rhizobium sp. TRM95111]|uniref:histidine phosphatase family protein n=1 Tax=Rhizobium alarense TaxID=2846851 RepID=UPI001F185B79|nr:histidine phosphatase family protein [Rhizobium alarense]MCF3640169.1 phosphoglycerate mutase family protein [Rhizobium alarense]